MSFLLLSRVSRSDPGCMAKEGKMNCTYSNLPNTPKGVVLRTLLGRASWPPSPGCMAEGEDSLLLSLPGGPGANRGRLGKQRELRAMPVSHICFSSSFFRKDRPGMMSIGAVDYLRLDPQNMKISICSDISRLFLLKKTQRPLRSSRAAVSSLSFSAMGTAGEKGGLLRIC